MRRTPCSAVPSPSPCAPAARHPRRPRVLLVGTLSAGALGGLGCGGDTAMAPPPISPAQAYWALDLSQHAVNLSTQAPYNTLQLTATPLTVSGTPLPGPAGAVQYQGHDSTVTVDATGRLTAHFDTQGQPTLVAATLTVQGVTHVDTVRIQVTDTIPQHGLATFSMQPAPDDSAKRAFDWLQHNSLIWSVVATDAGSDTICTRAGFASQCALQVAYSSSDPTVAMIDSTTGLVLFSRKLGTVVFRAETWAYGVAKRDSVRFTVGYRINADLNYQPNEANGITVSTVGVRGALRASFDFPSPLVLGVGALVVFRNQSMHPLDVVFDHTDGVDTASCLSLEQYFLNNQFPVFAPPTGGGTIAPFGGDTTWMVGRSNFQFDWDQDNRCRRFRVAGVYHYHTSVLPSDTNTLIIHP